MLRDPAKRFKGAFPGQMALTRDGRYLYVVDQASFQVHVVDTAKIVTGVDANGRALEPDNFDAVIARVKVGRYPFDIRLVPIRASSPHAAITFFRAPLD